MPAPGPESAPAQIEHELLIRAAPEAVFAALASAAGLDAWFTRGAQLQPWPGGRIQWRWRAWGPDAEDSEDHGEVLAYAPPAHFAFSWHPSGQSTRVDLWLRPHAQGCRLRVEERGFAADAAGQRALMRNACGWGEALTLCQQWLQGSREAAARLQPEPPFRWARADDLPALVALLADDALGARREDPARLPAYAQAFRAIAQDPAQGLLLLEDQGELLGMLQLSFMPGLSQQGRWRAQIESVRVAGSRRGQGLGTRLLNEALRLAGERGCGLAQLTSDAQRPAARRFYERLGFVASHVGMKRVLG